jgi:hypothetical protein
MAGRTGSPVVIPVFTKTVLYQSLFQAPHGAPFAETVTEDRWHQPWSEPIVKVKVGLATGSQQYLFYSESAQFPETVSEDRWHQPWSEPIVKVKTGLATANQPFHGFVESQFSETVSEDRWHQPWSEPIVKVKVGLATGAHQDLAWGYFTPPRPPGPDGLIESPWAGGPTYTRGLIYPVLQQPVILLTPGPPIGLPAIDWHLQQNEPVRIPAGLRAPYHQEYSWDPTAPIIIVPISGLIEGHFGGPTFSRNLLYQALFHTITPVTPGPPVGLPSIDWDLPYAEPLRFKPGLGTTYHDAYFNVAQNVFPALVEIIESQIGGPTFTRGLIYPATQQPVSVVAPPALFGDVRWWQPWSEPLRSRPGLSAVHQQAAFLGSPPIATIGLHSRSYIYVFI